MVEPVRDNNCTKFGATPPATPIPDASTLSSIGNEMWMALCYLFGSGSGGKPADPLTFQLAMQAIQRFMNQFPAPPTGSGPDQSTPVGRYLHSLWDDLTATNGDHPQSLAALAQDYTTNGFSAADLDAFNSQLSDHSHGFGTQFLADLQQWGSNVGGYIKNPPSDLTRRDFLNMLLDLPPSGSSADFLADVKKVLAELNGGTPPLDGACQMLLTLLNTPLDPSDPKSSLAALCSKDPPDAAGLQKILDSNPALAGDLSNMLKEVGTFEGWTL